MNKEKKLNKWHNIKKNISNKNNIKKYLKQRDVWWINLWENIWSEQNWKWEEFIRPVIVNTILNNNSFIWIPLSTINREWNFFHNFIFKNNKWDKINNSALLNQIRIFDKKRIINYYWKIEISEFEKIKKKLIKLLF